MSLHRISLLLIALLVVTVPVHADVFKYYDSNGNLVLTDTLPKDKDKASKVEKIEAKPVMMIPAFVGGKAAGVDEASPAKSGRAYAIAIQSPTADGFYQRNGGELITVTVVVSPELVSGHRLEALLDGKVGVELTAVPPTEAKRGSHTPPVLPGTYTQNLQLSTLDRGSHKLLVRVVDKDNKVLSSGVVTFQVQQTGLLGPAVSKPTPRH